MIFFSIRVSRDRVESVGGKMNVSSLFEMTIIVCCSRRKEERRNWAQSAQYFKYVLDMFAQCLLILRLY